MFGQVFFKDGIIFTHLESLYEKGLNTLTLHWRDQATSIFCETPSPTGMLEAHLKLNEQYDFETLEGDILKVSTFYPLASQIESLKPETLYCLDIKLDFN